MYRLVIFFFQFTFIVFHSQDYTAIKDIKTCNNGIIQKSKSLETISAEFEEVIYSKFFNNPKISKGEFWFKMADNIRWEHKEPYKQIIIFNGKDIKQRSNQSNISTDSNSKVILKKMKSLIISLIKSEFINNNDFSISYFENSNTYMLKLIPNKSMILSYVKSINLIFSKGSFELIEFHLLEEENEKIVYKFNSIQYNRDILDTKFSTF